MSDTYDPDELITRYQLAERLRRGDFADIKSVSRERLGQLAERVDAPRPANPSGRTKLYRLGDWLDYLRKPRSEGGRPAGVTNIRLTVPPGQAAEIAAVIRAGRQAGQPVSDPVARRLDEWEEALAGPDRA